METNDMILMFAASESQNKDSSPAPNPGPTELENVPSIVQSSHVTSPSDQGIPPSSTTQAKPADEKSLPRSLSSSKLKSGFEELPRPIDAASVKDDKTRLKNSQSPRRCSPEVGLPRNGTSAGATKDDYPITVQDTTQHPVSEPTAAEGDEHVCCQENFKKKVKLAEWVAFTCVTGLLIASLTVQKLQKTDIWELELWKWCVLVLAIFSGRLVSEFLMITLGFLIDGKLWLKEKVLYLLYGLKHSVQVFIWLVFVLSVWGLLIYNGSKRSTHAREIQSCVTRALASCLVGAAIWFIKTLLLKLLAASFHYKAFFEPIRGIIYHQHVIKTLLGNPLVEREGKIKGRLNFMECFNGVTEKLEEVIDAEIVTLKNGHRISAWNMRRLINGITGLGISIFDRSLDHPDQDIHTRSDAADTAREIFKHVDRKGKGCIKREDLRSFMKEEDVAKFIPLVQGPEAEGNGTIDEPTLEKWLVSSYLEKKLLACTLKDADTVIDDLNRLVSAIVLVVITIVSLLIMGLLTTETLIFISSQLLLVVFMFGNTARTVFEAVIFIFVTHPFDVEDRCVIDGVQLVVKKMDILTTTFMRYDGEKIYYPNSVLATKPISNFNRSGNMGDSVEFTVDFSTSVTRIADLKEQVKKYLESKPNYWKKEHSVVVKEIEDVNKLKMGLFVTHTINFQNPGDRSSRRSELVLELKRIFEEVGIKYRLLPQELQVGYAGSAAWP
ncbi:mechanosensitive ion channel protein 10-like [Rhodamnia argentea]|uniref:Mechanosensitive ion channel protein 10-like n=1 Tax=Rhodamnia argentea TaxID=178133 RepID=A0A8B8QXI9_9MYRT|nr:mechanosensitive ion channel protein 10-like [Rhodamnia argentea]